MHIAYTMAPGRGDTDLILFQLAQRLMEAGLTPCGTVQINTERSDGRKCDMDVQVLPQGPVIRISQFLGKASRGCRLDPDALEQSVSLTEAALSKGADFLIVNKFGKHEAEGRGFRAAIATALEQEIPVLVGLNQLNKDAFLEFVGGIGCALEPNVDCLQAWAMSLQPADERSARTAA